MQSTRITVETKTVPDPPCHLVFVTTKPHTPLVSGKCVLLKSLI